MLEINSHMLAGGLSSQSRAGGCQYGWSLGTIRIWTGQFAVSLAVYQLPESSSALLDLR